MEIKRYQKNYKFRYVSMKQKFCLLHVMVQTTHVMLLSLANQLEH